MNDLSIKEAARELAKQHGYLLETIERFIIIFGLQEVREMLEAYEQPPKTTIRINTLKITKEELVDKMVEKGFELKNCEWYENGLIIQNEPFPLGATTEYLNGYYFIQSSASWIPVLALEPNPNEIVIDLAAAPGGKATQIAQLMNNTGILFCFDISRERIKSLRSNLARCGVINTICKRTDAREVATLNIKADKVLLDAPCTGEGLMAVDRSRRKERANSDIIRLSKLQKELLHAALSSLKINGELVYSTCSTAPEENEEIINWALEEFPIEIIKTQFDQFSSGLQEAFGKKYHRSINKAIRLFPHKHGTEGFFTCKIKLKEELS
jgi:NOL1/NOP2/sun family putative RNA methylase